MIKNENIICISSIDWDFIWQGHQEIMSAFARNGNRVLFIENTGARSPGIRDMGRIKRRIKNWFSGVYGMREEIPGLYVFSPLVLPFPYCRLSVWINQRYIFSILDKWMKATSFSDPIIWIFLPTPLGLYLVEQINSKLVVYYCIDNFRVSSPAAKKIENSERKVLKKSDLVFVTSKELHDYCVRYNEKVTIFPFAVNYGVFEKARIQRLESVDARFKGLKRPVIGYVGGVHKWVDVQLLRSAALECPECSFVFVGPKQTDVTMLEELDNVFFFGKQPHEEIPHFIKNFDVCLIPYLLTDYTKNVYPTKLNEYLAMGKPVVSSALTEVESFNEQYGEIVRVARDEREFVSFIREASASVTESVFNKRLEVARSNSWQERIEKMSVLMEQSLENRRFSGIEWKKNFLRIYGLAKRKIIRVFALFVIVYMLIFYTPFLWFMAEPLKITDTPVSADCIVVFAGGVGESGMAAQGYEERVKYAVELYNKGYAKRLIFSSGYMYAFKEPLVMKALAVSLGVPEDAIILEDKAARNYENVKFTKEILNEHRWDKILLISSVYNMLRVSLVFRKNAPEVEVMYTPVPHSLFYAHPLYDEQGRRIWRRAYLQQLKGILHEYLGICYYWFKGWI